MNDWRQVARADDQFELVLVAERMEESLVLLADYLCWELRDVIVLHVNSLRDEVRSREVLGGDKGGAGGREDICL